MGIKRANVSLGCKLKYLAASSGASGLGITIFVLGVEKIDTRDKTRHLRPVHAFAVESVSLTSTSISVRRRNPCMAGALLSHGTRLAWLAAPPRVSHEPQPVLPPRPSLGRQVRGVVPQPPLKHGNTRGTSIAAELDAPPSVQCGVRFSLKPSRPVPCGLAVPTPRPMTMSTTRATRCCSCLPTPSLRLHYLRTSVSWTSSWWPCFADSPWTFHLSATGPAPS